MDSAPEQPLAEHSTRAAREREPPVVGEDRVARGAGDPRGRLPDFYVIGHPKSGTTALYGMLSQHPQIFLGQKEPRFFSTELHLRDMPRPHATPKTLDEYKAWFAKAGPEQRVGDVSPVYLWSREAPALIADARPDARLIAILREPASFLRSLHLQWLQNYVEPETDFRRAIELEPQRRADRGLPLDTFWPKALFYSEWVRYVEQLQRCYQLFAHEQVLVLIYDDYLRDNDATVRTVLRFLDVDEHVSIVSGEGNPSVQVQARRLNRLLRMMTVADRPAFRLLNRSLKALTPMRARQRTLHAIRKRFIFSDPQPADQQFLLELRHRFKPEVSALSEYLDRDLVGLWGYDKLS